MKWYINPLKLLEATKEYKYTKENNIFDMYQNQNDFNKFTKLNLSCTGQREVLLSGTG